MPHCIIETSTNLAKTIDTQDLCKNIHQLVIETELFSPEAIKTRFIAYDNYCVGEAKDQRDFIHITIAILSGRTEEQRLTISESVFTYLKTTFTGTSSLSVDIREMDKQTYKK